jgi:hypothetical protein
LPFASFPVFPAEVDDGVGIGAALFLVELPNLEEQLIHDLGVGHGLANRINGLIAPLSHASGVGDTTFFFHGGSSTAA